jgi:hypothetical protein
MGGWGEEQGPQKGETMSGTSKAHGHLICEMPAAFFY